jgi:hypothetical protein
LKKKLTSLAMIAVTALTIVGVPVVANAQPYDDYGRYGHHREFKREFRRHRFHREFRREFRHHRFHREFRHHRDFY